MGAWILVVFWKDRAALKKLRLEEDRRRAIQRIREARSPGSTETAEQDLLEIDIE